LTVVARVFRVCARSPQLFWAFLTNPNRKDDMANSREVEQAVVLVLLEDGLLWR
jgi:hypothetical protein